MTFGSRRIVLFRAKSFTRISLSFMSAKLEPKPSQTEILRRPSLRPFTSVHTILIAIEAGGNSVILKNPSGDWKALAWRQSYASLTFHSGTPEHFGSSAI